jgi:hypothetical protein
MLESNIRKYIQIAEIKHGPPLQNKWYEIRTKHRLHEGIVSTICFLIQPKLSPPIPQVPTFT